MNLPLNACMHRLANYTTGGGTRADSRRDTRRRKYNRFDFDYARRVHFSPPFFPMGEQGGGMAFVFLYPYTFEFARARGEVELAPICFHDNHETVSTLPARPTVTALFFFCFLSAK